MTVGVIILAHSDFHRVEEVARHWAVGGCPVVIHIDKKVRTKEFNALKSAVADCEHIHFSKRHKCEWGMWGIVAATQDAAEKILGMYPQIRHVYLSSGSCVPLRPIQELVGYLDANPDVDFIESAKTSEVSWIVAGLEEERFTLRFPFSWRTQRDTFDKYVKLQRAVGLKRKIPVGLTPHIGSQWWCLTRQTLSAILDDPSRETYDRYFRRVWIPDESYFQSLCRNYSRKIQSRSLTLSKFDFQGKPHMFYDDHLQLLRRSDCFVARKIWPGANRLYDAFLRPPETALKQAEPQPSKIDRLFATATDRRTRGRPGLSMQSRFPNQNWENGLTSESFVVLEGFDYLFEDFQPWLARQLGATVHGHLFAKDKVHFARMEQTFKGALSNSAALRDYNPYAFLRNLIWNTRGQKQIFFFGPFDNNEDIHWEIAKDSNASVCVISGAWLIEHFKSNQNFKDIRADAALRQKIEREHIDALKSPFAKAKSKIWTVADFLEAPVDNLRLVLDSIQPGLGQGLTEAPRLTDLTGFSTFVRGLKNQGMHPYLLGDVVDGDGTDRQAPHNRKPYLVR